MAFCAPTTNSYRRLVPGYEAPVQPQVTRSATARRPCGSRCTRPSPKAKRVEFRPPDPLANPYLAFSAMLMAGLDGIRTRLDPGRADGQRPFELPPEELAKIPTSRDSLDEALDALEADHEFLSRGGVFTDDLIATYVEFRREQSDRVKIRPAPLRVPDVLRRRRGTTNRDVCASSSRTSPGSRRSSPRATAP